jgi:hypothetical protein
MGSVGLNPLALIFARIGPLIRTDGVLLAMSNFRDGDRQTAFLLPPSVDEWLPERHLARFRRGDRRACRRASWIVRVSYWLGAETWLASLAS